MKSAKYFVNSSLVSVLLFRRRLKSVADVLKGIRSNGFIQSWWEALVRYWNAVCCDGPCGPFCPFTLGMNGSTLTCTVFVSGSLIPLRC